MAERPSLWGRIVARAQGEIPAKTLEAYRRAGGPAYDVLEQTEQRRRELKGQDPWTFEAARQTWLLCAWNAFVLQALGDQFLDADYQLNPTTAGYVPAVTAEQVLSFYSEVEPWLSRARQAEMNPAYQVDTSLPAELPPWSAAEPCPRSHLEGMLAALRLLRVHAESALLSFTTTPVSPQRAAAVQSLRQQLADATTRADYAEQLWSRDPSQQLHEQIEDHAKSAIETYYRLGQLLAMPRLLAQPSGPSPRQGGAAPLAPGSLPLPGEAGFDPWRLTDPRSREHWRHDPAARRAIAALWQSDPEPARTLATEAEIEAAFAREDIGYAGGRDGAPIGCYFCCPWAAVYTARRAVTIGGQRLRQGQQFTYDVSAEGMLQGEPFRRDILVTVFRPTDEVDYCDPREQRDES